MKLASISDEISNMHDLIESLDAMKDQKPENMDEFNQMLMSVKKKLQNENLEGREEFRAGFPNSTPQDIIQSINKSFDEIERIYRQTKKALIDKCDLYLENTVKEEKSKRIGSP